MHFHFLVYSYLPNKRGGWKFCQNLINGVGENVPNKRGGWKKFSNSINGEAVNVPNKRAGR